MIDCVYVVGNGSRWKNSEIRFSLRSISKHLTNYRDIHIVGSEVGFLKDVIHHEEPDFGYVKERNIYKKILRACNEPGISEEFLFMNDDHYLLKDFAADKFPNFYEGRISEFIVRRNVRDAYTEAMCNTYRALSQLGLKQFYFDVHTPMLIRKKEFKAVMAEYDWNGVKDGFIIKSLYLNTIGANATPTKDCKVARITSEEVINKKIEELPVLSSSPAFDKRLTKKLNELYPNPSPWEVIRESSGASLDPLSPGRSVFDH